jgi:hypothetical protein
MGAGDSKARQQLKWRSRKFEIDCPKATQPKRISANAKRFTSTSTNVILRQGAVFTPQRLEAGVNATHPQLLS